MPGLRHLFITATALTMTAFGSACTFEVGTPATSTEASPDVADVPAEPAETAAAELSQAELDAALAGYTAYEDAYIKMLQAHGSDESAEMLVATTTEDGPQREVAQQDALANQQTPLTVSGTANLATADLVESDLSDPDRPGVVLDVCLDSTEVEIVEIETNQFTRATVTMHRVAEQWLLHELAYEEVAGC